MVLEGDKIDPRMVVITAKKSENKWIRAFKIPIHAWTLETAKFIEDKCGGFIGIDKDTKLQTHLYWARICTGNNLQEILRQLEILKRDGV